MRSLWRCGLCCAVLCPGLGCEGFRFWVGLGWVGFGSGGGAGARGGATIELH